MPHEMLNEAMRVTWVFASADFPAMARSSHPSREDVPGKLNTGAILHDSPLARQPYRWALGTTNVRSRTRALATPGRPCYHGASPTAPREPPAPRTPTGASRWREPRRMVAAAERVIYRPTVRELPADERPRERLERYGAATLPTSELLAII